MEDSIKEKIRIYCEKINMKMDQLSIVVLDDGYVAKDGYTSIMFNKEGKVSSLPMYQAYGKKTAQLLGKGYAIYGYILIAIVAVVIIIEIFNK